jgi:uncharacterized protein (TIGR02145 family)
MKKDREMIATSFNMTMKPIFSFICLILLIPNFMEAQTILTAAENKPLKLSNEKILLSYQPPCGELVVTDIDGNTYNTVKIGNQCWLGRNLKTSKFNDGTPIALYPGFGYDAPYAAWISFAGYVDWTSSDLNYGYLYNWRTVDNDPATRLANNGSKNICPIGWHVPSDEDWNTMRSFLGSGTVVGGALKETGYTHWSLPPTGDGDATNSTGFTAVPGGVWSKGYFNRYGGPSNTAYTAAYFWSTSSTNGADGTFAYYMLTNQNGWVSPNHTGEVFHGMSVRCLKN